MEQKKPALLHRALNTALALLLCIAFIPVQALTNLQQAWAASKLSAHVVVYKCGDEYSLVFQQTSRENQTHGEKVDSYYIPGDSFKISDTNFAEKYSPITHVISEQSVYTHLTDLSRAFQSLEQLETVDLTGLILNYEVPTDQSLMFSGCSKLKVARLVSYAGSQAYMYSNCSSLEECYIAGGSIAGRQMSGMFYGCSSLKRVDMSQVSAENVYAMNNMFAGCSSLEDVYLPTAPNVTDVSGMFSGCSSLEDFGGISAFLRGARKVTNLSNLFSDCANLKSLTLRLNSDRVRDLSGIFSNCKNLEAVDMSGLFTDNVTTMSSMFSGCTSLKSIRMPWLNTGNVRDMSNMFSGCTNLENADLSMLSYLPNVKDMSNMFSGCTNLENVDLFDLSGFIGLQNLRNVSGMFYECAGLKSLDDVDLFLRSATQVEDASNMFSGCTGLKSVDLARKPYYSYLGNVRNVSNMFSGCTGLKSADLSRLGGRDITDASNMLSNCANLETVKVPIGSNPNMHNLFSGCTSLRSVDMESLCGQDMSGLFSGCANLERIESITLNENMNLSSLFDGCHALSYICVWTGLAEISSSSSSQKTGPIPLPTPKSATMKWMLQDKICTAIDLEALCQNSVYKFYLETPIQSNPSNPSKQTSITGASVAIDSKTHTGKKLTPSSVTVKLNGKTLRKDTDYIVSCAGGESVGSYKVTITGKGAYAGSKIATFIINPKGTSVSKLIKTKRGFTVKWEKPSKTALKQIAGYQIRFATSKSMKDAKIKTVKATSSAGKKCSFKISKLKGNKKYYVQVRTYKKTGGKTYYSTWSKAKAIKTKK